MVATGRFRSSPPHIRHVCRWCVCRGSICHCLHGWALRLRLPCSTSSRRSPTPFALNSSPPRTAVLRIFLLHHPHVVSSPCFYVRSPTKLASWLLPWRPPPPISCWRSLTSGEWSSPVPSTSRCLPARRFWRLFCNALRVKDVTGDGRNP